MRGIYKISNKVNGMEYIGETLDIVRRWTEHRTLLKENKHYNWKLQQDYNTYGEENFEFSIVTVLDESIKDYMDKYILLYYETYYIIEYKTFENGYNLEITLSEILKGNKEIYNEKDIGVIKGIKNSIDKGKIILENGIIYKPEKSKKKEKKREKVKNDIKTKNNKDEPSAMYDTLNIEDYIFINNEEKFISLKEAYEQYNIKCTYVEMFSLFREKGIFEYRVLNDKRLNVPCGVFKKLFQLKKVEYRDGSFGVGMFIKDNNLMNFEKVVRKLNLLIE